MKVYFYLVDGERGGAQGDASSILGLTSDPLHPRGPHERGGA